MPGWVHVLEAKQKGVESVRQCASSRTQPAAPCRDWGASRTAEDSTNDFLMFALPGVSKLVRPRQLSINGLSIVR